MKKLFLSLLVFILLMVPYYFGHSSGEIKVLDNGNCWIEEMEYSQLKIASFSDSKILYGDQGWYERILASFQSLFAENDLIFPDDKLEVFLYCGTFGSSLVFNAVNDKRGVCLWTTIDKKKKDNIKITGLFSNPELKYGACYGKIPGEIIATVSDKVSNIRLFIRTFKRPIWRDIVQEVRIISEENGVMLIKLWSDYHYQEYLVYDLLYEEFLLKGHFKSLEYNSAFQYVGDFYKIKGLSNY